MATMAETELGQNGAKQTPAIVLRATETEEFENDFHNTDIKKAFTVAFSKLDKSLNIN